MSQPLDITQRILWRDALIVVIDKPAGLAVHGQSGLSPGKGKRPHDLHLGHFLGDLRLGRSNNPEIAHRLDRETSGCLVLGRHPKALRKLQELFSQGRVGKTYAAVVEGCPPEKAGTVSAPLGEKDAQGRVHVDPQGKPALTHYRLVAQAGPSSLVWLSPETGRTHQLRVHLASLGCPIVGDGRYGAGPAPQLLLHARALRLPLYPSRQPLEIVAPWPEHWLEAWGTENLQQSWAGGNPIPCESC